jgi:cytochrome P450
LWRVIKNYYLKIYNLKMDIVGETDLRRTKIEVGDFVDRLKEILDHLEEPLTPDMIYAQGVLFFSAGFETTSNALSTFAYNLARHPEVQV